MGSTSGTPTAIAAATPTPTPTPTPTDISAKDAGAKYLLLVAPSNAAAPAWNQAVKAADYATLRTLAPQRAADYRTFADGLVAADWPDAAQSTVDALVGELASQIPIYLGLAASTTDDEAIGYLNSFASTSSAQKLRILLGLGNVPVV
jgi:hypothetical protein